MATAEAELAHHETVLAAAVEAQQSMTDFHRVCEMLEAARVHPEVLGREEVRGPGRGPCPDSDNGAAVQYAQVREAGLRDTTGSVAGIMIEAFLAQPPADAVRLKVMRKEFGLVLKNRVTSVGKPVRLQPRVATWKSRVAQLRAAAATFKAESPSVPQSVGSLMAGAVAAHFHSQDFRIESDVVRQACAAFDSLDAQINALAALTAAEPSDGGHVPPPDVRVIKEPGELQPALQAAAASSVHVRFVLHVFNAALTGASFVGAGPVGRQSGVLGGRVESNRSGEATRFCDRRARSVAMQAASRRVTG